MGDEGMQLRIGGSTQISDGMQTRRGRPDQALRFDRCRGDRLGVLRLMVTPYRYRCSYL